MRTGIGVVRLSVSPCRRKSGEEVNLQVIDKAGVLVASSGIELGLLQTGRDSQNQAALLQTLTKLVKRNRIYVEGRIASAGDYTCTVELKVFTSVSYFTHPQIWKHGADCACLFLNLEPLGSPREEEVGGEDDNLPVSPAASVEEESKRFTLADCFEQLPQHVADLEVPELQISAHSRASLNLARVPIPLLRTIVAKLGSQDLASLAMSCRFFRALASNAVPGLLLSLYPHQRAAVRWMLAREEARGQIPHPTWRRFQTEDGQPFWGCSATGKFSLQPPKTLLDAPGGLFCDEPGLGKTITGLALVLKTKGTIPAPPPGLECHMLKGRDGQTLAYYLLPREQGSRGASSRELRAMGRSSRPAANGLLSSPGWDAAHAKPEPPTAVAVKSIPTRSSSREACSGDSAQPQAQEIRPEPASDESAETQQATLSSGLPTSSLAPTAVAQGILSRPRTGQGPEEERPRKKAVRFAGVDDSPANGVNAPEEAEPVSKTMRPSEVLIECNDDSASTGTPPPARKRVRFTDEPVSVASDAQTGFSDRTGRPNGQANAIQEQQPLKKRPREEQEEAEEQNASDEDSPIVIQCEICSKWRSLPKDTQIDEDAPWICRMHPDAAQADCHVAVDNGDEWDYDSADGYVAAGEPASNWENVSHFRQLLAGFPELVEERHSCLWWLAEQPPQAILKGFQIPRAHLGASKPSFTELFSQLLLVEHRPRTKRPAKQPSRATRKAPAKPDAWKQDPSLHKLHLDTVALKLALLIGPQAVPQKVFLSPATLLVVPPPLVQHWVFQVQQHTRFGAIRLLVLSADKERSNRMPAAHSMAWDYDLVITTLTTLSKTWPNRQTSPFMQVHWLRVVVDEGHLLNSLQETNRLQMGCALHAERRWLMTGTPTPGGPRSEVAHLQPLLAFLHNRPYGTEAGLWQEAVLKPFAAKKPAGRARLMELLARIMIRAAKSDLYTIPPLLTKVTVLDFSPEHAVSYNMLVDVVHRNLLTSDWYDEDHNESLLNFARNGRWAKQMLDNVRRSCNVAGNCNLQAKESDIKETLELLIERHGHPPVQEGGSTWVPAGHPFAHLEDAMRASSSHDIVCLCQKCGSQTRLPILTPCAHLLCSTCTSEDRERCPLPSCRQAYVMQSVDDPVRKETNPNPKWDVPTELIEWQPSYAQKGAQGLGGGGWSEDYLFTASTKCVHLLRRLYEIGAAENPAMPQAARDAGGGILGAPLAKVIVFSQFNILLVERHLARHEVPFALLRAGQTPAENVHALDKFQNDDECGVLLMDSTGSVGLDLSFASWVFLLEPLEDTSLYQQIVARAHRMGAKQPVHVETLVMKGTAEEELVRLAAQEKAGTWGPAAPAQAPERDQAAAREFSRRATILRALRRVPEAGLPEYQDLPSAPGR